ncbi:MAG: response regulator [Thermomicrobiales bacterium]|nr:response regulator [Thermomicrobiales bacterium]
MAKSKILVVDDSATDTMLISNPLRAEGYEVITARDGEEALRRLASDSPDLVLLDVIMPGKNGFQLCRQIRNDARYGKLPVILVTSKDQEADKFWGMRQGATAYITKPFASQTLLAAVRQHV